MIARQPLVLRRFSTMCVSLAMSSRRVVRHGVAGPTSRRSSIW
jgi:hypothetical protein